MPNQVQSYFLIKSMKTQRNMDLYPDYKQSSVKKLAISVLCLVYFQVVSSGSSLCQKKRLIMGRFITNCGCCILWKLRKFKFFEQKRYQKSGPVLYEFFPFLLLAFRHCSNILSSNNKKYTFIVQ